LRVRTSGNNSKPVDVWHHGRQRHQRPVAALELGSCGDDPSGEEVCNRAQIGAPFGSTKRSLLCLVLCQLFHPTEQICCLWEDGVLENWLVRHEHVFRCHTAHRCVEAIE